MTRFRTHIAFFFLVLFCRILVPEAAVLAMHEHEHTEDAKPTSDFKLSTKHQHCHVDETYHSDFTSPEFFFEISLTQVDVCYVEPYGFAWKFTYPNNTFQRGPPTA